MHWRYWTFKSYLGAVFDILHPIFRSAHNHKYDDHAVMMTELVFNPAIDVPSDVLFVEDCFNRGLAPKRCALSLVKKRMYAYGVSELDVTIQSTLFGAPGTVVRE